MWCDLRIFVHAKLLEVMNMMAFLTDSRLRRFHSYEDVTEVRVSAKLDSVTFDLTTNDGPLLQAGASGLYMVY